MQPSRLVPPPPTGFLRSSRCPTSFRRCTCGPFSSSATTLMACLLRSCLQSSLQSPAALMVPRLVARSAPALSANPRQGFALLTRFHGILPTRSSSSTRSPAPWCSRQPPPLLRPAPALLRASVPVSSRSRGLLQPGLGPPPDQPVQFQLPVIMPATLLVPNSRCYHHKFEGGC